MNTLFSSNLRRSAQALAVLAAVGLAACAAVPQSPPVDDSKQFAADWREHTHRLYNQGRSFGANTVWEVPPILSRGNYRVIQRNGDGAELLEGYRVKVEGFPTSKIYLMLPMGKTDLEVLDEKYIPDTKVAKARS